ncbi:Glycosyltransferase involved in cell wall bisynthesis [Salegentibacter echinorum]|uniref:Glycosyltransferase involved in cell wall bisynthesis n=1 Tax=Salegentibacter echinorum TaxID=1073325 RepID=A0A1M5F3S9_SALEC|nr:glycosyltransferase family 4 protein [Salegentibacter echinorum]SHF86116.1 Glycosyltransferase involved in cell wall bisynthesis [Salegentibacter echinorum]
MNILHLSAINNWGGGENQIELLGKEFKKNFPQVENTILCVEEGLFHKHLKTTKLNYQTVKLSFNLDLRYCLKIKRICKTKHIDLIHIHDTKALSLAVLADNFFNLPPMVFSKKTSFPIKNRKSTLLKYNYTKIERILCVSEKTKEIAAKHITDKSKLQTLYHGLSIEKQKSISSEIQLRKKLEIVGDVILVGHIGNHIPAKDLTTLANTIEALVKKNSGLKFHFVQIGRFSAETPRFLQQLKAKGIKEYVSILGFMPNAAAFIPQLDYLLVTSNSEGLPNVIFEAFYYKTPVIATNVGGIPEIVAHLENGLLAEAKDAKKLAEYIVYLVGNPELKQDYIEKSYQKLLENFTTKRMAKETFQVYKNILNGRS